MITKSKINIGMVGLGRVASRLAEAIQELDEFELWSVCSRSIKAGRDFAKKFNAISKECVYTNFHNMISDRRLDAVIIATPDKFHFAYAFEALVHNKHVFIEKPVCTEVEDGVKLLEHANKSDCVIAVGYHLRWHTGLRMLAKKVHADQFGQVNHISINWGHTFIKEAGWRISKEHSRWWNLSTLGTHCLDIVRWLMLPKCGEVKKIHLMTTNAKFNTNDESAMLSIEFESGATATIFTSILFDSPFQLEIYGVENRATAVNVINSNEKGSVLLNGSLLDYPLPSNLYANELKNFADAIRGHNEVEVSLKEGLKNVSLLINKSID